MCEARQTGRTVCTPVRRFGHLGLAWGTVALPRNVTKEARVRIAARVAGGPSPSFLRRMPDAELALGPQLDLSKEVSNSCQASRGSPKQRHSNYFWGKTGPGRNAGPLISINGRKPPLPRKPAHSMAERGIHIGREGENNPILWKSLAKGVEVHGLTSKVKKL